MENNSKLRNLNKKIKPNINQQDNTLYWELDPACNWAKHYGLNWRLNPDFVGSKFNADNKYWELDPALVKSPIPIARHAT